MRIEQGFLADVHGQRPEDSSTPPRRRAGERLGRRAEAYRRVLEQVTLADVVAGTLPGPVAELVALDGAWRSFGDVPAGRRPPSGTLTAMSAASPRRHRVPDRPLGAGKSTIADALVAELEAAAVR